MAIRGGVERPDSSPRRALSEAVAERIESRILDGTFGPGQRLPPEREMAAELRVNRSSVREALKRLQQLGLVEIQRGSGIRVRSPEEAGLDLLARLLVRGDAGSRALVGDLFELRQVLLTGFVRLALERATEGELRELEVCVARAVVPGTSAGEFTSTLRDVQDRVARMTRNRVVLMLWNTLRRIGDQEPLASATISPRPPLVSVLRRFALAALARDGDRAERALRELLRAIESGVLDAVEPGNPPLGP
jgi:DNA-binding FadR family transcriptional regulator